MKSEEKKSPPKINDISANSSNPLNNNFSQNINFKNKTITTKNNTKYILNNPISKKFNFQKQKTDYILKSNSNKIKNNQLPLLTFNSISFYDSIPSDNPNNLDIDSLKKKLISNKSNINKKRTELQDLKIQYNKLIDENKNHKNLIYEILHLENEPNSSSIEIEENNINIGLMGRITEEQLISKINSCKIDEDQEKRLKDSYELINLRMELNNKKKLLLNKNNEYDKLKNKLKFKNMNEITTKLEDLIIEEEKIKKENAKMDEILQKNTSEILPNLEKDFEDEKNIYDEISKIESKNKKEFNDKLNKINELKAEIQNIENKAKFTKNKNLAMNGLEYQGSKTIGIKLKARIEKMKFELEQINKYKKEKREDIIKIVEERKSKIDEQKKKNSELEKNINEITEKNKELYMKTLDYNEEKKKLENRGKESNKDIKKMKEVEDKLNIVKNKKNELIKECEEKEEILKNNKKEQNEKNKNILEQLNNLKNNIQNMNKQVDELNTKINDMQNNIDNYQKQIDNKKNEIEKLNDVNEDNNDNNGDENTENNKKEEKSEDVQKIKNKLVKENKNYRKENEKIQKDIILLEEQIQKYINMNNKLNQEN
jgi:hypothetical protein